MPVWEQTIRLAGVFHNDGMTFHERRDAIVCRLRRSAWLKERADTLVDLVDELAEAESEAEFDDAWDLIYDYADADRVWIETR